MAIPSDPTIVAAQQQAHAVVLQVYIGAAQTVLTLVAVGFAIAGRAWQVAMLASRARARKIADVFERHEAAFTVPQSISDQIDRLREFGEAALPLQNAIHLVILSNYLWDVYDEAARGDFFGDIADDAVKTGHDSIYPLKGHLLASSSAIGGLFSETTMSPGVLGSRSPRNYFD
jgi:hypothetical protein